MKNELSFFNSETSLKCSCGLIHHIPTRKTVLGKNIIKDIPLLIKELHLGNSVLLVFDENTYKAAGLKISDLLKRSNFEVFNCLLKKRDHLEFIEPDEYSLNQIISNLKYTPDFLMAVGSGVINDLTKLASHRVNLPYVVLGTAPSMDGYPSPGASMLLDGYKQTLDATPPQAIFLDLDILLQAPLPLIQSGFADLLGKTTANADWILRNKLLDENVCERTWDIVKNALYYLENYAEEIGSLKPEAIHILTVALLNSGFSMVMSGDSRPASGSEHLVAHYLENISLHRGLYPSLHGLRVGVATNVIKAMYDRFLKNIEHFDWEKVKYNQNKSGVIEKLENSFGSLFPFIKEEAKYKIETNVFKNINPSLINPLILKQALIEKLSPIPDPSKTLKRARIPFLIGDLGFPPDLVRDAFLYSRFMRKRVTILDLIDEAGLLSEYLDDALEL